MQPVTETRLKADEAAAKPEIEARLADFVPLTPAPGREAGGSLNQLLDVTCTVTAELGRAKLAIGDVLKLNIGSVLELDRSVSDPVDVLVQGVRLARGEVVVVNGHFAVRIKEVVETKKR